MSFGAFNKKSTTLQTSNTSSVGQALSEVSGNAAGINGSSNSLSFLDGGAIESNRQVTLESIGSNREVTLESIEKAAKTTFDLTKLQADANADALGFVKAAQIEINKANSAALSFAKETQDRSFQFAFDSGRSDVSLLKDAGDNLLAGGKSTLWLVGVIAGLFLLKGVKL